MPKKAECESKNVMEGKGQEPGGFLLEEDYSINSDSCADVFKRLGSDPTPRAKKMLAEFQSIGTQPPQGEEAFADYVAGMALPLAMRDYDPDYGKNDDDHSLRASELMTSLSRYCFMGVQEQGMGPNAKWASHPDVPARISIMSASSAIRYDMGCAPLKD